MADTKLADLTALTTPSGDDILYVVDDPAGTPLDRKIALNNLFTRGTITADAPVIDASQTWNASGVTFTGLKFNATSTASATLSRLLSLSTTAGGELAGVVKDGSMFANLGIWKSAAQSYNGSSNFHGVGFVGSNIDFYVPGNWTANWTPSVCGFSLPIALSAAGVPNAPDVILSRRAAANLRLGAADAAVPVAQTLSVQSRTGTDAAATAYPFTITGAQGTGTGAGGSIIFQVAPAGGTSNAAQNGLATAWSISGAGHFLAGTDNTYDIGATGATRPRNIFAAGYVRASGSNGFWAGSSSFIFWDTRTQMSAPASNVLRVDDPSSNAAIIQTRQFTVSNLPSAATYPGSMAFVSDATATTARSTVAGSGSNKVMVMSDGINWLIVA